MKSGDVESRGALGDAARSSVISFIGAITTGLAGFALALILGRALGPTATGVVFQMIAVFTIAGAIAKVGLDTTAVWMLPRLTIDRRGDISRVTALLLLGALAGGVAASLVVLILAPLLAAGGPQLALLIRWSAAFLPVASVLTVALAVTRGLGGIRDFVLLGSIALPAGRLIAVAIAASFAGGAFAAGIAWLALLPIILIIALIRVHDGVRRARGGSGLASTRRLLAREVATYSGPRALSSSIEQALLWLDVIIVGLLTGPALAGIYAVVSRLIQTGTMPSTAMRIVVAPQFSRMLHQQRHAALKDLYLRTTQWIVLLSMPVYVLLSVLAVPVLDIFGPGFEFGAPALTIMCLGAAINSSTGNVQSLLLMSGLSGRAAVNKIVVLAVSLTLLFTLIPLCGLTGAAVAWTVSMILDALLATVTVRLRVGVRLSASRILLAIAVSATAAAVPSVIARLVFGETLIALVSGAAAAVVLWTVCLFLTRRWFALDEALASLRRPPRSEQSLGKGESS
ncbi:oligosaccharide flippase family protein [Microbacterium sp. RU33B]|uniref:oligosaccharide flippase family protein n=1 Tax=Microbacterium sp. RU33B TaxID=1907390 RepID=UPI00095CA449|nr:oligosaccharide flippase family protein [Microbacterium sp. RU33B]SIT84265.1 Membrane protein involved in the export of O-antigen and teichoic acid [Microbacterium sp. RU33B]